MMMNDFAISNIQRIVNNEIALGHAILGVISVDESGHMLLCWRTDDQATAMQWETELRSGAGGKITREIVNLPKEA